MKKYTNLADLIIDYRRFKGLSQLDLSVLLDVDTRTVSRWEKGTTLLNPLIKEGFIQKLHLPHQLIHNLNSQVPIPIFYDIEYNTFALDSIDISIHKAAWLNEDLNPEIGRIQPIDPKNGTDIYNSIQGLRISPKKVSQNLLEVAVGFLPELNVVLQDHSGYYSGHTIFLSLKYEAYSKIRNKELKEENIDVTHLSSNSNTKPQVYYLYVANAGSTADIYYLMNYIFSYFKKLVVKDYIFALIETKEANIKLYKEMGLRSVWKDDENPKGALTLLEGNFELFFSEQMR